MNFFLILGRHWQSTYGMKHQKQAHTHDNGLYHILIPINDQEQEHCYVPYSAGLNFCDVFYSRNWNSSQYKLVWYTR